MVTNTPKSQWLKWDLTLTCQKSVESVRGLEHTICKVRLPWSPQREKRKLEAHTPAPLYFNLEVIYVTSTYFNHDLSHDPASLWASWKGCRDRWNPGLSHAGFSPLKNKIQPSKFEDPIGLIQGFMNWAESHPVTRIAFQGVVQKWKVFIGRRRVEQGS